MSLAATGLSYPVERATLTTRDGTRVGYQSVGHGPPVVLANGLGGTFGTWVHLYEHLAPRYRVLSWDYRGFYASDLPADRKAVGMDRQVDDLEDLLDHLEIRRAAILGWSMGTQVSFELYRRRPASVAALGIINGTAGQPFRTLRGGPLMRHLAPLLTRELGRQRKIVNVVVHQATAWGGFIGVLKRVKFVSAALDETVFRDLAGDFGRLDFGHYFATMLRLGEHDAWDVLPTIRVPTTVIVGDRDFFTPAHVARKMAARIPAARLVVIRGGSHYTPLESPDEVNEAIDDLLERCSF